MEDLEINYHNSVKLLARSYAMTDTVDIIEPAYDLKIAELLKTYPEKYVQELDRKATTLEHCQPEKIYTNEIALKVIQEDRDLVDETENQDLQKIVNRTSWILKKKQESFFDRKVISSAIIAAKKIS